MSSNSSSGVGPTTSASRQATKSLSATFRDPKLASSTLWGFFLVRAANSLLPYHLKPPRRLQPALPSHSAQTSYKRSSGLFFFTSTVHFYGPIVPPPLPSQSAQTSGKRSSGFLSTSSLPFAPPYNILWPLPDELRSPHWSRSL